MTQKNKQLLLADLCARLPYGIICYWRIGSELTLNLTEYNGQLTGINKVEIEDSSDYYDCYFNVCNDSNGNSFKNEDVPIEIVKPYLRPMSSMTEEEREDFWWNVLDMDWREDLCLDDDSDEEMETAPFPFMENGCGFYLDNFYLHNSYAVIDWLNEHHFDYRGLIEKGLALEAPEGMYKTEEQL